ncbi:MAG: hypothetical protein E6J34_22835 [Chloroflexi bacterium]|nr:MAG: hypothetical protein E6J34_22835 [Chloroflexota bacterium]
MGSDIPDYHRGNDHTTQQSQYSFYSNPYEPLPPPPPRPPQQGKSTVVAIVLLVIVLLIVSVVGLFVAMPTLTRLEQAPKPTVVPTPTPSPTPSPTPILGAPSVFITSPIEGSKVPLTVTMQGSAFNVAKGRELWILVVANGVKGYFPQQGGPITIENDGTWISQVTIGVDKDTGRKFEIYTALADQSGRDAIDKNFSQTPSPDYVGIYPLAPGITLMSKVDVIRG